MIHCGEKRRPRGFLVAKSSRVDHLRSKVAATALMLLRARNGRFLRGRSISSVAWRAVLDEHGLGRGQLVRNDRIVRL